jgi:hypothetical protein
MANSILGFLLYYILAMYWILLSHGDFRTLFLIMERFRAQGLGVEGFLGFFRVFKECLKP